jgi:hypothetical protein
LELTTVGGPVLREIVYWASAVMMCSMGIVHTYVRTYIRTCMSKGQGKGQGKARQGKAKNHLGLSKTAASLSDLTVEPISNAIVESWTPST